MCWEVNHVGAWRTSSVEGYGYPGGVSLVNVNTIYLLPTHFLLCCVLDLK